MRVSLRLSMVGCCLIAGQLLQAADTPSAARPADAKPAASAGELADYRTAANAITAPAPAAVAVEGTLPGYLGVHAAPDARGRIILSEVQADSPGSRAGLMAGDVVTHVDGQSIGRLDAFRDLLHSKGPTKPIKLSILRKEKPLDVVATLAATSRPLKLNAQRATLGLEVGEPTKGDGLPIARIQPGSPAERAKLKVGEVILKVDGQPLTGPGLLRDLIGEKKPGDKVTLTLLLADKAVEISVALARDQVGTGRFGVRGSVRLPYWKKPVYKLAVIPIEFPDFKHNSKVSLQDWSEALFSSKTYVNKNNVTGQAVQGSLNDYFQEISAGNFRIEGKVFPWVEMKKKRAEYAPGSGTGDKTVLLREIMDKFVARDGKAALKDFDGLFFIYAGERTGGNRGSLYYPHSGGFAHDNKQWTYALAPEGGSRMTPLSGYCREVAFMLGLPDLAARTENAGSEGLGVWCLMSSPITSKPQHPSAWAKEKLGWIQPAVIDPSVPQKLILSPIEGSAKECFKIPIKSDGSEYLLLENRAKRGFDADLPAEGLLIWRVVDDRPILEESHGVEGSAGPRVFLSMVPYPSQANNAFTPHTTPSSRSPRGGGRSVYLTEIRRLADGRIAFHIGYEFQ